MGDVMEKQMIIRGAALLFAGVSVSTFAVHQLTGNSSSEVSVDLSQLQAQPQVMGAGLAGNSVKLQFGATTDAAETKPDNTLVEVAVTPPTDDTILLAALDAQPQLHMTADQQSDGQQLESLVTAEADLCSPTLTSAPMVDALIELVLDAPCHPEARIVVSHNDLAFSAYTSAEGSYSAFLPALSVDAKVDVFLSDDIFLQTAVTVPDANDHLRVALQWSGEARFALHAYHDGADYGDTGHVHALKPFDPNLDEAFLISLGEARGAEPMIAEIYSLPVNMSEQSRVEVELQFMDQHCGKDFSAYLSDNSDPQGTHLKEITFAVPDCPAEAGMVLMGIDFAPKHAALSRIIPTAHLQLQD